MMADILTFSQCLDQLMNRHGWSQADLCLAIGCRRADLKRVLSGEATEGKRRLLHQALQSSDILSTEERRQLDDAFRVSQMGVDRYKFCCSIEKILSGQFKHTGPEITVNDGTTLKQRLAALAEADALDIICLNSCYPALVDALLPLFKDSKRSIRLRHFIHADARTNIAASYIASFFPLLFDSRYQPYGIDLDAHADTHPVGGNFITFQAHFANHRRQFFFGVISNESIFEMVNADVCNQFGFVEMLVDSLSPSPFSLKESSGHNGDFSSLCLNFLSYELNRATYSISNDISFHQIPTQIALAALHDQAAFEEKQLQQLSTRAAGIHEQRYQNQYNKKKVAYRIMTLQGCRSFLKTGRTTDHFFAFRAFTPEERKAIFADVIRHAKENAFFIPLLVRDPNRRYCYNLVGCDKLGVVLDATDTDYDLTKGYQTVLLTFPEFTRQYMEYYLGSAASERCYSRQESLELLEKLYQEFLTEFHLTDD